jgi:exodeoxyribonuclease-1
MYLVCTHHPEHCFHPAYASWGYVWDLRRDPEPFLNLSVNELKANLKKISPKALRLLKTNKSPVVLDKKFALKEKAYSELDLETILKRAKLVRNSENFCKNIQIINKEAAEEKAQTQTQEDLLPEETLYEKFIPNKDTALFKTWHSSSWEDKLRLLDKFQDKRCSWFGQKIIYQEAPHILPPDLYKNIKSEIARRILSKNKEKWQTIGMAYTEIDTLRDQASNRDDQEELKKLDEINEFIMSIEKKYEIA